MRERAATYAADTSRRIAPDAPDGGTAKRDADNKELLAISVATRAARPCMLTMERECVDFSSAPGQFARARRPCHDQIFAGQRWVVGVNCLRRHRAMWSALSVASNGTIRLRRVWPASAGLKLSLIHISEPT